jgi:hypothetical protein
VGVTGSAELRAIAADVRRARDTELQKRLANGLRKAARPIDKNVRKSLSVFMPASGGYAAVVTGAFRARVSIKLVGRGAAVTVVGTAKGKGEKRDLAALDAGTLRHPVFGRYRRVRGQKLARPWVAQGVPPGFFTKPAAEMVGEAQAQVDKVAAEIAAIIAGKG